MFIDVDMLAILVTVRTFHNAVRAFFFDVTSKVTSLYHLPTAFGAFSFFILAPINVPGLKVAIKETLQFTLPLATFFFVGAVYFEAPDVTFDLLVFV